MRMDYSIYDSIYEKVKHAGWLGWGGDARIAGGPEQVNRILAKRYVPRHGSVLELGCGEGHLCRLLAALGYDVTGVDISSVAIDWALQKQSAEVFVSFIQADLSRSCVLAGQLFDLIVDGNCLHCILGEDREVFLCNVHRLLSVQGIFFVSSLCSKTDETAILYREGSAYRHVPSVVSLEQELNQANFQILEWEIRERDEHDHISLFAKRG
jgi:2-polyprenyl-3-methyl-5-hydroxy-6-metoxy-1,4-benzoquinol methylase